MASYADWSRRRDADAAYPSGPGFGYSPSPGLQAGYSPSPGPQAGFGTSEAMSRLAPRVIGGGIGGYGAASPAPSALSGVPTPGSYSPQYAPPVGTPGPLSHSYVPPPASQARVDPYFNGRPDPYFTGMDRNRSEGHLDKGGFSSYPSFVAPAPSGGVIVDGYRQVDQGEAWESGGYRYRLGDRYALDGEGRGRYASAGYGQSPDSVPAHRGAGAGYPGYSGAGAGYGPGAGYPGVSNAYGNYDHLHDSHAVHELPSHQQYHGPMPPPSAPGTPAALPPYMQEDETGQRKAKKKDKKKDGKKKKGAGCC
mmetsp:Transcript_106410/g.185085  ORF Transcript_106410/g.185085 Transcript_106410/m.185085 type:complete len:309 (-) Transcript_106410:36-962(-)